MKRKNIPQLIEAEGDKLLWQFLPECLLRAQQDRHGTQITFGTQATNCLELEAGTGRFGIIIWLPREKWDENTKLPKA